MKNTMRLLLLSNSTNVGEEYLGYPLSQIKSFLGNKPVKCLFIPYAAVTISFDEYEQRVKTPFLKIGHDITSIHKEKSALAAVEQAEAIVVGGGNTFHLLRLLQQNKLMEAISAKIKSGVPYIGWSAGSNVTCPTISTTNDMPIVESSGFKGFNLIPFQINPHYTDLVVPGHGGETRDQRIVEFLQVNQDKTVVGLREGTLLHYENDNLVLIGSTKAKIFRHHKVQLELGSNDNFNFLIEK